MKTTADLRERAYAGGKVTLKEWADARTREADELQQADLAAEYEILVAEGERLAAERAVAEQLAADIDAFNKDALGGLRKAYSDYMHSRQTLVELLDDYEERRQPIATRCSAINPQATPPDQLNKWALLNLADREAQGEAINPHALHGWTGKR